MRNCHAVFTTNKRNVIIYSFSGRKFTEIKLRVTSLHLGKDFSEYSRDIFKRNKRTHASKIFNFPEPIFN